MRSSHIRALCAGTFALLAATVAGAQTSPEIAPEALRQITVLQRDKASRTPAQRKMDSRLIFAMKRQRKDPMLAQMPGLAQSLKTRSDGTTLVEMAGSVTPALEQTIRQLGGTLQSSHPEVSRLRAWVPLAALEPLAARADVRWIRPAMKPRTTAISEGDRGHLTDVARNLLGVDGRGVKICVISDGVDQLAALQAQGELPAVDVLPGQRGTGSEGTALLEVVHDLAPGAALGFATATESQMGFAANIRGLRARGCDVITDDLLVPDEPVFQDGILAKTIGELIRADPANPLIYVASAGNEGGVSRATGSVWEGDFRGVSRFVELDAVLANDFRSGATQNFLVRDPLFPLLTWSDPLGASSNDYDLFLLDAATGLNVVDFSNASQDGTQDPFEAIDSSERVDTNGRLVIVRFAGDSRYLRLSAFAGFLEISTRGAIFGHGGSEDVITVAAAAVGTNPAEPFPLSAGVVESFSSDGPRRMFFRPDGTPITPGNFSSTGGRVIQKPDVVGADGVTTRTVGFERFFGTSAAAPHIAAIAGLVLSASDTAQSPSLVPVRFRSATALKALFQAVGIRRNPSPLGVFDEGAGVVNGLSVIQGAAAGLPCFDSVDNDGDRLADLFVDPGCANLASSTEAPACDDGVDNDDDGLVDVADRGCISRSDGDECGSGAAQSLAVVPLLAYLGGRRRKRTAS